MSHGARTRHERRVARQRNFVHAPKRGASSNEGQTAGRTMTSGRGPRGIRDLLRYEHDDDTPVALTATITEILNHAARASTMGMHKNIAATKFPKQGSDLGSRCVVLFHFDTSVTLGGVVVRDDVEEPFQTIIKLDDGRFIRAEECLYSPEHKKAR